MDISKFDAAFFGVPPKLVDNMDPQLRIMLELTHEALIDSGNYLVKQRQVNIHNYIFSFKFKFENWGFNCTVSIF